MKWILSNLNYLLLGVQSITERNFRCSFLQKCHVVLTSDTILWASESRQPMPDKLCCDSFPKRIWRRQFCLTVYLACKVKCLIHAGQSRNSRGLIFLLYLKAGWYLQRAIWGLDWCKLECLGLALCCHCGELLDVLADAELHLRWTSRSSLCKVQHVQLSDFEPSLSEEMTPHHSPGTKS